LAKDELDMTLNDGWPRGLYRRIAVGFVALITLVLLTQAITFVWLFQSMNNASSDDDLRQQAVTWTRAISADLGRALEASRASDVARRLEQLDATRRVFVIFRDGQVIGPAPERVVTVVNDDFGLVPPAGPLPNGWERSVYGAFPLRVHGNVIGVVGMAPRSALQRYGPLLAAAGIILLLAAVPTFSIAVVRPIKHRLQQLQAAAKQLERGELGTRLDIKGTDEVAELAAAFNSMADELERRTTALQTSDRLRRQLVADVSHELMTPLTAVLGHLETLSMEDLRIEERERRKQVQTAMREAQRLRRIIGDLLDAARHEAGGVELTCEEIATSEMFESVMTRHRHACSAKEVTLEARIAPEAESFEADPFRIEQALDNAVANALRHTRAGGHIALIAQRRDACIVLAVSDSGEGIPPEHLPHIFDRFYKASSATGIASPGSGLGLSIVKAIVKLHGGQVSASSESGRGTTIRMELPAAALMHVPEPTL
jgi:signal transduction histidine kinase